MIRAVGINTKQNNQKKIFGWLEGLRNAKRGFGACLARKAKKGEMFLLAGSTGLRPVLSQTFCGTILWYC
jgi:hypothetical protein